MDETVGTVTAVHAATPTGGIDPVVYGPGSGRRQPEGGKQLPANGRRGAEISVSAAARMINNYLEQVDRGLRFQVDEGSGKTVIKVIDNRTHEVVRQIPPEVVLRLAERLQRHGRLDSTGLESRA